MNSNPKSVFSKALNDLNYPKVTIVTPSYNQGAFLENTILSVLNQDYSNIEYIIIDGGSTDGSVDIIKKYEDKLQYWISEHDNGQCHAINKGFERASGQVFNWVNSDDILMPSAVKIAVNYMVNNPDIGMVYGDRIVVDGKGNFLDLIQLPSFSERWMMYNWYIPQETVFFRRRFWLEVGGLNVKLHYYLDYDLWVRLNKVTQLYHIPFVMGAYRKHPSAKTFLCSNSLKVESRKELAGVIHRHFFRRRRKIKKKFYKKYSSLKLQFEKNSWSRKDEIDNILRILENDQKGMK